MRRSSPSLTIFVLAVSGAAAQSDRGMRGVLLEEAERTRITEPERWAEWQSPARQRVDEHLRIVENWRKRGSPPRLDLSDLKLPLPFLVHQAESRCVGLTGVVWDKVPTGGFRAWQDFGVESAIARSADQRRMDYLLQWCDQTTGESAWIADVAASSLTAERAALEAGRRLQKPPRLREGNLLFQILERHAGALSPDQRRIAFDYVRDGWAGLPDTSGQRFWRVMMSLDRERAARELVKRLQAQEKRDPLAELESTKLLIDFAAPSADFADAVRFLRGRIARYEIYGCWLSAALWRSDATEFPGFLADLDEVLAGKRAEAKNDSADWMAVPLVEYAPAEANPKLRKYVSANGITLTTRFRLLERLVRAGDEQAASLVQEWLAREDEYAQRWLRDNLANWGENGARLARTLEIK